MESIKLKPIAHQNPSTRKPGMTLSASRIIRALITNKNNPKVINVIGIVSTINIGFKVTFNMARNAATISALQKLSTMTPDNK